MRHEQPTEPQPELLSPVSRRAFFQGIGRHALKLGALGAAAGAISQARMPNRALAEDVRAQSCGYCDAEGSDYEHCDGDYCDYVNYSDSSCGYCDGCGRDYEHCDGDYCDYINYSDGCDDGSGQFGCAVS